MIILHFGIYLTKSAVVVLREFRQDPTIAQSRHLIILMRVRKKIALKEKEGNRMNHCIPCLIHLLTTPVK